MQRQSDSNTLVLRLFRIYRWIGGTVAFAAVSYLLLLNFPQVLFANTARYDQFVVYSREPLNANVGRVLEKAEAKLRSSPLYDESMERRIYLTDSFGMYALLSHKAYGSFANSVPFINNVIVNKNDPASDLVYIPRSWSNERSLSGVIAHETVHLFIRKRYGTLNASLMPVWKNEGYCEYVAGESTITLDEGIKRWRENPNDDAGYRYAKYHLMVKFVLEKEHMTVDEFFATDLDQNAVAARTFANIS